LTISTQTIREGLARSLLTDLLSNELAATDQALDALPSNGITPTKPFTGLIHIPFKDWSSNLHTRRLRKRSALINLAIRKIRGRNASSYWRFQNPGVVAHFVILDYC